MKTLRQKVVLLKDICPEAVELLKDKHVPMSTFWVLKRMAPMRQIEAAELSTHPAKAALRGSRALSRL